MRMVSPLNCSSELGSPDRVLIGTSKMLMLFSSIKLPRSPPNYRGKDRVRSAGARRIKNVRALTIQSTDLVVEERATPVPGPYEVLVQVHAAGLNAADLHQRAGFYPAPPGWPEDIPGMELAGVVTAVGDRVVDLLLGRRVCAIVGGGAQATHCVLPAEHLLFVPSHVDFIEAGGFPEAFMTAYDALASKADLKAGERVLISGAAGGVGVAAVQIARVLGAEV